MSDLPPASATLLDAQSLGRRFGETRALSDCSLSLVPGEIHALVGENGSGKSTLIKILSGVLAPDSGSLLWDGTPMRARSPRAAQAVGVATVYQETLILEELSVRDNLMLGLDHVVRRHASIAQEEVEARAGLAGLGLDGLDLEHPLRSLSLAQRQLVAITRSLLRPWRLLILDESTSALDVDDRDRLFSVLRRFREEGRTILFVTHRMDEIEALADRITVLRSGRSVATLVARDAPTERLLELMSTREAAQAAEGRAKVRKRGTPSREVARLDRLALAPESSPLDLGLFAGEIVGVAGLEGHGQVAFLECLAGRRRPGTGAVRAGENTIRSPRDAARARIAFLPRDRKTEGIFASLSVADNITVSALRRFARGFIISPRTRRERAATLSRQTRVKSEGMQASISSLSGGNQQKALLARLIATDPELLVLNDPMRGVDLGAKRDLYEVLEQLAQAGAVIVLLSTELAELCLLCDRVIVFHDGAVTAIVDRDELDERTLIAAMFGRAPRRALEELRA